MEESFYWLHFSYYKIKKKKILDFFKKKNKEYSFYRFFPKIYNWQTIKRKENIGAGQILPRK